MMIRTLVLALLLSGCARWEHDPLDAYQGAAGAYEIPVTTVFSFGF